MFRMIGIVTAVIVGVGAVAYFGGYVGGAATVSVTPKGRQALSDGLESARSGVNSGLQKAQQGLNTGLDELKLEAAPQIPPRQQAQQ